MVVRQSLTEKPAMIGSAWPKKRLGDLIHIKHGYAFKGEYFSDSGPFVVLTPGNFYDQGGFKGKGGKEKHYVGEVPREFILKQGDLLVAMTEQGEGLLGSSAIVPSSEYYLHNQRLGLVTEVDPTQIDRTFLYYLFNTLNVRQQIRASASGTKVRHTSPTRIYEVAVSVPSLAIQRRIAEILSAYDDLIENNTRRIKILEEMAQALYREWFVNFRFPGHERTNFVRSPSGRIPEGWESKAIKDLYGTASGGTPSRKVPEYFGGSTNWLKTQELNDRFVFDSDEQITEAGLTNSSAKVFPENTVVVAMYGATIGKLGILAEPSATNQACCALLKKLSTFGHSFAFLTLLTRRDDLIGMRLGAAQQNISQLLIRNLEVLKPTDNLMLSFNKLADPMLNSIRNLQRRNQILRKTRELLLPKVISGQISC